MYTGTGGKYMRAVAGAVKAGYSNGILDQRPMLVNLRSDMDHTTQTIADLLHMIDESGGRGKSQGHITRFGINVALAHPEGYDHTRDQGYDAKANLCLRRLLYKGGRHKKRLKALTLFILRAGYLSPLWKNAPNSSARKTLTALASWKRNSLHRTRAQDWECSKEMMELTKRA